MTTPKRPAKSGKSWTFKELDAYNVRIKTVNIQEFFGISHGQLPAPAVDPLILENFDLPDNLVVRPPSNVVNFFIYLHDTTDKGQPASVDDFTHHLLGGVLGFDLPDGVALTRDTFPFIMSGQRVKAIPNVSVRRAGYQIILVQKDKISRERAEPRLVATALGAFSVDNEKRTANGLSPMASKRYIGIVTIGTAHFLYKITVTQALLDAVRNSQFPSQETIVERFIPPVANVDDFLRDGMLPLDNRHISFQCYEALKVLL